MKKGKRKFMVMLTKKAYWKRALGPVQKKIVLAVRQKREMYAYAMAQLVYETDSPTANQLRAVKYAVDALVERGILRICEYPTIDGERNYKISPDALYLRAMSRLPKPKPLSIVRSQNG